MLSNIFSYLFFFLLYDLQYISFAEGAATVARTIIVNQLGHGDFNTIQDAINSISDGNTQWIKINVTSGVYREKVTIPSTKPYILLQGNGISSTVIDWNDHSNSSLITRTGSIAAFPLATTFDSATFTVLAENFVARDITFKNSYGMDVGGSTTVQAVAALVGGDKSAFYGCAFRGYQDTLCDFLGRHYFDSCWIEGAVDFIFGFGQSIYVSSSIKSTIQGPQPGWLTAHAKVNGTSEGGFVFKYCTVSGTGKSYLGRAWNQYATVVFYRATMADIVVPGGWDPWNSRGQDWNCTKRLNCCSSNYIQIGSSATVSNYIQIGSSANCGIGREGNMTFAESGCRGPGANTSQRVPWEKKLDPVQLEHFISNTFIDNEGWLGRQP